MSKNDRFHPIITIVIYYGDKEWDGPYSLADMMMDLPEKMKGIFSDYKMNLLQVRKSGEYTFNNEDVQTVFQLSRKIYQKDMDWIRKNYKDATIKAELGIVIGEITKSKFLIEQSSDGREVINMCTALEELRQEGIEEGKLEGIKEGKLEGIKEGKEREQIKMVRKSLEKGLSLDLISEITELSVEDIIEIKKQMA